jgi:hypothetical protein
LSANTFENALDRERLVGIARAIDLAVLAGDRHAELLWAHRRERRYVGGDLAMAAIDLDVVQHVHDQLLDIQLNLSLFSRRRPV